MHRYELCMCLCLGWAALTSSAWAIDPPAAPAASPATPPAASIAVLLQSIRQAPDPSAAITAYGQAAMADIDSPEPQAAFVRRMVDFDLADLAGTEARDLNRRQPDNGLAWAVVADLDARHGLLGAAIAEIASAARLLPDDPFVLRTAGRVVAWYQAMADAALAPPSTKDTVESLHSQLSLHEQYIQAYNQARDFYQRQAAAPTSEAASPMPAAAPPIMAIPDNSVPDQAPPINSVPPALAYYDPSITIYTSYFYSPPAYVGAYSSANRSYPTQGYWYPYSAMGAPLGGFGNGFRATPYAGYGRPLFSNTGSFQGSNSTFGRFNGFAAPRPSGFRGNNGFSPRGPNRLGAGPIYR